MNEQMSSCSGGCRTSMHGSTWMEVGRVQVEWLRLESTRLRGTPTKGSSTGSHSCKRVAEEEEDGNRASCSGG
eukprot:SAG31_NODE_25389_length_462_cov_0.969697_1_plen_72_part_01